MAAPVLSPSRPRASLVSLKAVSLTLLGLLGILFVAKYVFHYYLHYSPQGFGEYWSRRAGLLVHVSCGMMALLTGPWQFSRRLRQRNIALHRLTGQVYLIAVALGAAAAFYLALTTLSGWAWGFAVAMLGVAWLTTSGMAYYAILQRQISIHKEWMVRSYVVTFAFVTFRILYDYPPTAYLKPESDRAVTAMWACWALPLLFTEVILQLRRMRKLPAGRI